MAANLLKNLSTEKYRRLLPRIFPDAVRLEIRDKANRLFWQLSPAADGEAESQREHETGAAIAWSKVSTGLTHRKLPNGQVQYRAALVSSELGKTGWLIATYENKDSVPMSTAPETLRRSFTDATSLLLEELELQSECNQLAVELTERYEELNLVYSTQDQVEYFEEGQEALVRLVHNCADYLNVGIAALICRDRNLVIHNVNNDEMRPDLKQILDLLGGEIYRRVESQVASVVLNETDDAERKRLYAGRSENVLANPIIDEHGTAIGIVAVVARQDIHTFSNGDRNLLEVMAKKASRIIHTHHDSLTGLMNRSGFESALVTALANSRNKNVQHCLLHIDIDQLHVINDLLGHQEGDVLIRRVAKTLRSILRESDSLARHGGDEFGVLLPNCDVQRGLAIADKIRNAIHDLTVVSASRQLSVTASIGIAKIDHLTDGIVGVMAAAEIACKAAKEDGRDRVQVFAEDNTTLVRRSEEVEWIGRVQEALRDNDFVLYCQPVVPLNNDGHSTHFEVLIRLSDNGKILPPNDFLPAAERYQLMPQVDRWVVRNTFYALRTVCQQLASTGVVFCINLSGQSLTNTGFLAFVADELAQSGVAPENICFEITETAAISNFDEATDFMAALQKMGCRFALDDFGAGLSSFGYLKMLPVDYLKIDGSFVKEVKSDKVSLSMVSAICQIAQTMGLDTIAEFVGDQETVDVLSGVGVDFVQGYFIGKPEPLGDLIDSLQEDAAERA